MITRARLLEMLSYDPETGIFVWLRRPNQARRAGMVAGSVASNGYMRIGIDGRYYGSHRLVFLYLYGSLPKRKVDHRNGIRSDNRASNLREADDFENARARRIPNTNTSGERGVVWNKKAGMWQAQIGHQNVKHFLGLFDSLGAASAARRKAEQRLYGDFLPRAT